MTSVSALFDKKPWALYTEIFRLFVLLALITSVIDERIVTDFSAPMMRQVIANPAIMTLANVIIFSAAILLLCYDTDVKEKKD